MSTNQQRREAANRKLERQQERRGEREQRRKRIAAMTATVVVLAVIAATVAISTLSGPGRPASDAAAKASTTEAAPPPTPTTPDTIPTQVAALPTRPTPLPATVNCQYQPEQPAAKPVNPPTAAKVPARGSVAVALTTGSGPIDLTLDRALAPCTVNSFVSLAQQGYFNDTTCHRLTTEAGLQVLQCGDPTGQGSGGPGYTVPDEDFPQLKYGRGLLAMANTGQPNSGGSQFFMIYGDAQLPPNYTVFGKIGAAGLQTVDAIARAGHDGSLDPSPGGGTPINPVRITTATVQ